MASRGLAQPPCVGSNGPPKGWVPLSVLITSFEHQAVPAFGELKRAKPHRGPRLPHRPSRMSVSVLRGESASGSSLSSITDGRLLASAAQKAGAKSAVASTV